MGRADELANWNSAGYRRWLFFGDRLPQQSCVASGARMDIQAESLLLQLGGITTPGVFLATQFCSALREPPGIQTEARIEMMSHCAGVKVNQDGHAEVHHHGSMH